MQKQNRKSKRAAARPQALTVGISIPEKAKPLFLAFCELYGVSRKKLATLAVNHFLTSEAASSRFDDVVNGLMGEPEIGKPVR